MLNSIKKFPLKTVLLTLFAWGLFWEIKETITQERLIFFRWIYSSIWQGADIEVKTYILNDRQVREMLSHPNEEIQQPTKRQIGTKNMSVVLRIRNLQDGVAWGRLAWKLPHSTWEIVDVSHMPLSWMKDKYAYIVIPVGILVMVEDDTLPEPITVRWKSLYVYR